MRVEPELPDHPKFMRLKRRIGPGAAEILLRMWGHCQNSQRGGVWKGADAEYVEVICRWTGAAGALFEALVELRFIDQRNGCLTIHDWDTFNSKARANWTVGKLGGRPRNNPTETQPKPTANPMVNPTETQPKPTANPMVNPKNNLENLGSHWVNPRVSELVSELVSESPPNNKGDGEAWKAEKDRERRGNELKMQFAALAEQIGRLAGRELTDAEERELRRLEGERDLVQKKQAAGDF